MELKNLLIASDFSKHADWAFQRAMNLAKMNPVHLHFLHVLTPPLSSIARASDTELQPDFFIEKKEIEENILHKIKANGQQLSINVSVISGRPADEVVRYADENHCGLIIVGAHGHYYMNDYILGTTSSCIIGQSHVPVLLVKKAPDFLYDRILIATDLSQSSKETIQFVFQCFPNAAFQVVHIVDIYYRQFFNATYLDEEGKEIQHSKIKKIVEKLDVFLSKCRVDETRFEKKIVSGYSADAIVEQANEWKADLLAFGTHGKSMLHYFLMGSVAKRLLHLSSTDMLVIPKKR